MVSAAVGARTKMSLCLAAVLGCFFCTAHSPRRMSTPADVPEGFAMTAADLADPARRRDAEQRSVEIYPEFTLAFVEFDDQGRLWSRAQLDLLDRTLAAEASGDLTEGVVLIFFVHGWKHDARLCEENVACFRAYLTQIAADLKAATRVSGGKPPRLVGIYGGWRGRSVTVPVLEELTFWARKRAAERIGAGELIELLTHLDQFVQRQRQGGHRAGLTVVAHSFGGTMVFEALANILKARLVEALGRRARGGGQEIVEGFGDLVVLVNPAFEASLYAPLQDLLERFDSFSPLQTPVLAIVASETDGPNRAWFPIGRSIDSAFQRTGPRSDRSLLTTAIGNYAPFLTHRLEALELSPLGDANLPDAFGRVSQCRCLLRMTDLSEEESRFLGSFLSRDREGKLAPDPVSEEACASGISLGRVRLTCLSGIDPSRPFWIVRAKDNVIHGHSGFFTSPFLDFVRHEILESRARLAARLRPTP